MKQALASNSSKASLLSKKKTLNSKFVLPKITTIINEMFQKHLIIHYFVIGIAFQRIEKKKKKTSKLQKTKSHTSQ